MLIGLLEDDVSIQEMLRLLFSSEGHKVKVYTTAAECLEDLHVDDPQPGGVFPDLLLVDLRLPRSASGTTVIERIRANPRLMSLPIILMTASLFADDIKLADLRVKLLTKPFDIDDVMRLVNELTSDAKFVPPEE